MAGTIIPADLDIDMDGSDPSDPGDIKIVKGSVVEINNCDSTIGWSVVGSTTGGVYVSNNIWTSPYSGVSSIALILPPNSTGIIKYTNPTTSISIYSHKYIKCRLVQSYYNKVENCVLYFGESTYNEQSSTAFSIPWAGWTEKSWTISATSTASRDAVTRFGLKAENTSTDGWRSVYIDYIIADPGPSQIKGYDGDQVITLYPKTYSTTYIGTGSSQRITLNAVGTPCNLRVQDITPGRGYDEWIWWSGQTSGYSIKASGGDSTHAITAVGDSFFDVGTTNPINRSGDLFSVIAIFNDTTA